MNTKKILLTLILALYSLPTLADEGRGGVRSEYDDLMKGAGKWELLENTGFFLGILSAGISMYAYNRGDYYRNLEKSRPLNSHEAREERVWQDLCNNAGYGAAGFVGIGLVGWGMELHLENRAHGFALDMGVKF